MTTRPNRRPSPPSPSADDNTDEPMASLGEAGASLKQPTFPQQIGGGEGLLDDFDSRHPLIRCLHPAVYCPLRPFLG